MVCFEICNILLLTTMQILLALFIQIYHMLWVVSPPSCDGGDRNLVCVAHSFEKWHLKDSASSLPDASVFFTLDFCRPCCEQSSLELLSAEGIVLVKIVNRVLYWLLGRQYFCNETFSNIRLFQWCEHEKGNSLHSHCIGTQRDKNLETWTKKPN